MMLSSHVYYNVCKSWYIDADFYLFIMYHLYYPVNKKKNEIIAIFFLISWNK